MSQSPIPLADVPPGIDEALIGRLIRAFYARARADDVLGPVFASAVEDWDHHIEKIADFWSGVMLRTSRYDGRPLRPHLVLPLEGGHFDRWLDLFEATARDVCEKDVADAFIVRARRIADSFEMAVGTQRGEMRPPRHYARPLQD